MSTTTYTVFCRHTSRESTTWIDTVEVESGSEDDDMDKIRAIAINNCAVDWDQEDCPEDIECFAVGEGRLIFHIWED